MDRFDEERYSTRRLPKAENGDGPTARYMRWLAELDAKVVPLPVVDMLPLEVEAVAG